MDRSLINGLVELCREAASALARGDFRRDEGPAQVRTERSTKAAERSLQACADVGEIRLQVEDLKDRLDDFSDRECESTRRHEEHREVLKHALDVLLRNYESLRADVDGLVVPASGAALTVELQTHRDLVDAVARDQEQLRARCEHELGKLRELNDVHWTDIVLLNQRVEVLERCLLREDGEPKGTNVVDALNDQVFTLRREVDSAHDSLRAYVGALEGELRALREQVERQDRQRSMWQRGIDSVLGRRPR